MSGVYYPTRDGYTEHGWFCPEMGVIQVWREGQPEATRPLDKYEPVRVTRTVGEWVRTVESVEAEKPSHPVDLARVAAAAKYLLADCEGGAWAGDVFDAVEELALHRRGQVAQGDWRRVPEYPDRPAEWLRVGELRDRIKALPDDPPIEIEYPFSSDDEHGTTSEPALYAFAQASDASGACSTDPMTESTCGVLIIGCDPADPMADRKGLPRQSSA